MKLISLILFCFVLWVPSSFGQNTNNRTLIDQDKTKYEENVFDKEFNETEDTSDQGRKLYDKIPEKLPNWVFESTTTKIIGFSDPNMEKQEAIEQAVLRAKAIFALFNYCTISNITDDYTNLVEDKKSALYATKFQDFTMSKIVLPYNNSEIVVSDTFYTKYNEGIVLIDFGKALITEQKPDTIDVKAEHLQVFIERNFKREKIEFYNFNIHDKLFSDSSSFNAQYNYKRVNRGYDISSIYGNHIIEFKERTYNYRTEIDFKKDSLDNEYNYYRLSNGLWNSYLTGTLHNITLLSKFLASQVKNSNDFYTLKNQGLIRTVARNKVSLYPERFKLIDNNFYMELNGNIYIARDQSQ